jgi:hypothetical protein
MLDIFNNDAFSTTSLTQSIVDMKHIPSRIRELGLFETESVDTTTIAVEKKGEILALIPPSARGGNGTTLAKEKRDMRSLIIPHFEINDAIYAEEVQNVRAFGQEQALETVAGKVAMRLRTHGNSHDVTEEHARMGAITGIVTYADGTELDLFAEFGVTAETEIDFDLDNASPADGVLRKKCAGIIRQVSNILGGVPFSGLHAFVGDNFFDDLLGHKEVRETYKGWNEAQILRDSYIGPNRSSYGIFQFGGIVFENYRGAVESASDGQVKTFINTDKCQIFPLGVPGLFKTVYSPADYEETVNTMGQARYARQYAMPNGKGRHLDSQMNALQYCSRPKTLIKAKRT